MTAAKPYEIWIITGSQHLYGPETLAKVAANSKEMSQGLDSGGQSAAKIVWQPVVTTSDEIYSVLRRASAEEACAGVICWMHTFSPAKMWIKGLAALTKPLLHLHTQHNRDLPWSGIDMDFMNLNQAAHGDREFGFICARVLKARKIVAGYWQEENLKRRVGAWSRVACAWADSQNMKIARFGDNMRDVAVTEGNKVSAQISLGYSVNGYGVGDLAASVAAVKENEVDRLVEEYRASYAIPDSGEKAMASIREAARIEAGTRAFLEKGGFQAFTTTFEDLHGLKQLPGLAAQRLMAQGYGFAAEGDWKTAGLVRSMKVMAQGLQGGVSFMEDYTYHLAPGNQKVLGAHMLEVCPSIAVGRPSLEVHPLGIGGKEAPARLVFDSPAGMAVNASLIDLGARFRLIVSEVKAVPPPQPLPKLPVARVVWEPLPDLATAAEAWILAGGAHHTGYSRAVTAEQLADFADLANIECVVIGAGTELRQFRNELRWNNQSYH